VQKRPGPSRFGAPSHQEEGREEPEASPPSLRRAPSSPDNCPSEIHDHDSININRKVSTVDSHGVLLECLWWGVRLIAPLTRPDIQQQHPTLLGTPLCSRKEELIIARGHRRTNAPGCSPLWLRHLDVAVRYRSGLLACEKWPRLKMSVTDASRMQCTLATGHGRQARLAKDQGRWKSIRNCFRECTLLHRIFVFDRQGRYVRVIGKGGREQGSSRVKAHRVWGMKGTENRM